MSPASTRSIKSNSKNAKILYNIPVKQTVSAWRHMRLNSIPTTQTGRMAVPSGHWNLSVYSWRNRVSVPTRIHLIITVLFHAICFHEFSLPATSHTFMWLHSLTAPETIFYQPPRHLPVPPRPHCFQRLATHQHYLHNIPTLLKQFVFLDGLDPDDRGSKLIQNISNISNDTVSYTRRLASSKSPYYNTYLSLSSVITHLSMSELFQFCR